MGDDVVDDNDDDDDSLPSGVIFVSTLPDDLMSGSEHDRERLLNVINKKGGIPVV